MTKIGACINMLEIFLIIMGVVLIVGSFILSDKREKQSDSKEETGSMIKRSIMDDIEERKRLESIVEQFLTAKKEEAVTDTDNELSRICNEKIMAVDEFSEQILEKIEENHKEVVFLYNMLNEKETELKALMQKRIIIKEESIKKETVPKENIKKERVKNRANQQAATVKEKVKKLEQRKEEITVENNNPKILELYQQGKTVTEIAKILNQGQGEVKLVIDLYQQMEQ